MEKTLHPLFTIICEYKGGTYTKQVKAEDPVRALEQWAGMFSNEDFLTAPENRPEKINDCFYLTPPSAVATCGDDDSGRKSHKSLRNFQAYYFRPEGEMPVARAAIRGEGDFCSVANIVAFGDEVGVSGTPLLSGHTENGLVEHIRFFAERYKTRWSRLAFDDVEVKYRAEPGAKSQRKVLMCEGATVVASFFDPYSDCVGFLCPLGRGKSEAV